MTVAGEPLAGVFWRTPYGLSVFAAMGTTSPLELSLTNVN
jgi:hypothetical protein